jgi:hypothetical protein
MISEKVESIRSRIRAACERSGRDPRGVTLVAVSKTFPADDIREVVRAGVADIGENYVQELLEKRRVLADDSIRWHFIGHLQTNKVRSIADWVTMVHSVDSLALAVELDRRAARAERVIDCLVEVNTTGEGTKFGLRPDRATEFVQSLAMLSHIRIAGLMTIGPFLPDPEGSRPMFCELRDLRGKLAHLDQPNAPMQHLSMGMTGDFEVAIEEGATLIRIGTALFGRRIGRA